MKVLNIKADDTDNALYIGRDMPGRAASLWANPYRIKADDPRSRAHSLALYRARLFRTGLIYRLPTLLKTEAVACWCAPDPCHGHVLSEFVEALRPHHGSACHKCAKGKMTSSIFQGAKPGTYGVHSSCGHCKAYRFTQTWKTKVAFFLPPSPTVGADLPPPQPSTKSSVPR